jgi:hypothetical protein
MVKEKQPGAPREGDRVTEKRKRPGMISAIQWDAVDGGM